MLDKWSRTFWALNGKHGRSTLSPQHRIYASLNCVSVGSGNGLPPLRYQAITWTNAGLLSNGPLGTNFSEIQIEIQNVPLMKIHLKTSAILFREEGGGGGGGHELNQCIEFFHTICSVKGTPLKLSDAETDILLYIWIETFPETWRFNYYYFS